MAHHWPNQRASYLALHSSLIGLDGVVNYDYIVTKSINWLLIGSRCIPNNTKHALYIIYSVLHVVPTTEKEYSKSWIVIMKE